MSRKEEEEQKEKEASEISRIRIPKPPQTFGLVARLVGGSRMEVKCFDGKGRICRIPGRLKRKLWVRAGDLVVVEPWEFLGDTKGDVLYKYSKTQIGWLRAKGYLQKLEEFEEF